MDRETLVELHTKVTREQHAFRGELMKESLEQRHRDRFTHYPAEISAVIEARLAEARKRVVRSYPRFYRAYDYVNMAVHEPGYDAEKEAGAERSHGVQRVRATASTGRGEAGPAVPRRTDLKYLRTVLQCGFCPLVRLPKVKGDGACPTWLLNSRANGKRNGRAARKGKGAREDGEKEQGAGEGAEEGEQNGEGSGGVGAGGDSAEAEGVCKGAGEGSGAGEGVDGESRGGEVPTIFDDPRVEQLMADPVVDADACVCMSSLLALLTNLKPYTESWHVPVQVRVYEYDAGPEGGGTTRAKKRGRGGGGGKKSKKKVLWDKPVLKSTLTIKDKKAKFYKTALRDLCVQHAANTTAKKKTTAGAEPQAAGDSGDAAGDAAGDVDEGRNDYGAFGGVVFSQDYLLAKEVLTAGQSKPSAATPAPDEVEEAAASAAASAPALAAASAVPPSTPQSRTNLTYDLWLVGPPPGIRLLVRTKVAGAIVEEPEERTGGEGGKEVGGDAEKEEEKKEGEGKEEGHKVKRPQTQPAQMEVGSSARRAQRVLFSSKLEHWPVEGPEDTPVSAATRWWLQLYLQGGGRGSGEKPNITEASGDGERAAKTKGKGKGKANTKGKAKAKAKEQVGGDVEGGEEGENVTWLEPCLVIGRVRASDSRVMELQPRTIADVLPGSMPDPLNSQGGDGSFDAHAKFGLLHAVLTRILAEHDTGECVMAHAAGDSSIVFYRTVTDASGAQAEEDEEASSTTPGGNRKLVGKTFDLHTEHNRFGATDTTSVPFTPLVWRFADRAQFTYPIARFCRSFGRNGQCSAMMTGNCSAVRCIPPLPAP
jgi:hypothetical protein